MPCEAVNQIGGYAGQLSPSMFSAIGQGCNSPASRPTRFNERMKMNFGFNIKVTHPKGYDVTMRWCSVEETVDTLSNGGYPYNPNVPRFPVVDIQSVRIPSYNDITMGGRYSCD